MRKQNDARGLAYMRDASLEPSTFGRVNLFLFSAIAMQPTITYIYN